jgi:hypothetical protein
MLQRIWFAIAIAIFAVYQAVAQTQCPMTYAEFEFAVPHLDLEACPADLAREGAFCRAPVGHDAIS